MKTADELWELLQRGPATCRTAPRRSPLIERGAAARRRGRRPATWPSPPGCSATTAYIYGGEPAKAFVTFSWCVSRLRPPTRPASPALARTTCSGSSRTMISALTRFPEVPLDRTQACSTTWSGAIARAGTASRPSTSAAMLVARHLGDAEQEDVWFERWQAAERDELSDCAGCDPTTVVVYLGARGRYEEAVALAEPVLAGELSCNRAAAEHPHRADGAVPEDRPAGRGGRRAPPGLPGAAVASWPTSPTSPGTWRSARAPATSTAGWRSSSGTSTGSTRRRRRRPR